MVILIFGIFFPFVHFVILYMLLGMLEFASVQPFDTTCHKFVDMTSAYLDLTQGVPVGQ